MVIIQRQKYKTWMTVWRIWMDVWVKAHILAGWACSVVNSSKGIIKTCVNLKAFSKQKCQLQLLLKNFDCCFCFKKVAKSLQIFNDPFQRFKSSYDRKMTESILWELHHYLKIVGKQGNFGNEHWPHNHSGFQKKGFGNNFVSMEIKSWWYVQYVD